MRYLILILVSICCSRLVLGMTIDIGVYPNHVAMSWLAVPNVSYYQIKKSRDKSNFQTAVQTETYVQYFGDVSRKDTTYAIIQAFDKENKVLDKSDTICLIEKEFTSDDQWFDMVQYHTFQYFWDFGHPISGMARERNTSGDIVTTGGTGFGIMAILVGIHRGYITREEGLSRLIKIVSFLQFAERYHGVFPHWINGMTGKTQPFSQYDDGGDVVETALLMQGLLTARCYFDMDSANEKGLRSAISKLWEQVQWSFYTKDDGGSLYWHWSPNHGWKINQKIRGHNETMIAYILAISSPTFPIKPSYWSSGWAPSGYKNGNKYYNIELPVGKPYGGPLFFAHYSFIGFDPRHLKDSYTNYFVQNKNHTLINRAYCIANPLKHKEYGASCWGLTASDTPGGYKAHEPFGSQDNGTISPTAALSSMPYTPIESLEALHYFYNKHGAMLWGKYGFKDAFNPDQNWYASSYLAIDQGPIVTMIENHRSALLWHYFMKNNDISAGIKLIGFKEDLTPIAEEAYPLLVPKVYPTLFSDQFTISNYDGVIYLFNTQVNIIEQHTVQGPTTLGQNLAKGFYLLKAGNTITKLIKW